MTKFHREPPRMPRTKKASAPVTNVAAKMFVTPKRLKFTCHRMTARMNVESAAIVVSSFMVGLGMGSLAGGWVSEQSRIPLLLAFSIAEFAIGVCGVVSLDVFKAAGSAVSGGSLLQTGAVCFALLLVPTLFMGSTLPLLVTHHVRSMKNVGRSVSWLYFVNNPCYLSYF